ncbi:hypothetical protein fugu_000450 [Takifugu bimaculatus]|uniref:Kinesin motor domain-containing protein n=1 Tax=Takifugu bimaculatus TaxID=433685 RepID=A0A4Z2CGZ7_9TELE|nr:hypothetical protein fugu_000450 [Takifugu bimaculatus]
MESCLAGMPERIGPVEVDDIRKDLLREFTALPVQEDVLSQSENLQVYLRVRPMTVSETKNGESQDCVTIEGPDTVVLKPPRSCQSSRQSDKSLPQTAQRFSFTQVFGPDAGQKKVFDGSVRGLVRDVLDGGNCLVFTYGVTNAGKTFTFLGPDHDSGLLPRSLSVIFNSIDGRLYSRNDLKPQRCRDYSRLTPDQQAAEVTSKKNLLRPLKESDKSSSKSTFLEGSSLTDSSVNSVSEADTFSLSLTSNVCFSVWVSFCEIYNDNIHDLLEQVPSGHHKRTVLRLSQDVKGNSFIKDLRWVQVNSSEEAYRVMKIGKKNQSFSATRLNQLSSRSHSIFSIRIIRVEDIGVPRVLSISELALCDLAGSERCSRTQNTGERLKEAGNINSSLLTLGKCISAMRLNQQAKFQHHIPFRESKLTHFLQFFFCGSGRVCMVVNINQSSSCFDETLNVLKFSALAQKVVVLNSKPAALDDAPHRSALELSMIIDEADQRRNLSGRGRKTSMVAWETTLEDVMEDEDDEEWEEEESMMEGTVLDAEGEEEENETMEEEQKMPCESALRLLLEAQIREEVSTEFLELFSKMEKDYSERLAKEKEILEEKADRRVEIFKDLISKTVRQSTINANEKEEQTALMEIISSLTEDLEKIKEDARSVHSCLTEHPLTTEALQLEKQQSHEQLQEARENLEKNQQKVSELMEMCQEKDEIIQKLQAAVEDATRDRTLAEASRHELQQTGSWRKEEEEKNRKRACDSLDDEVKEQGPARKRVILEEEIWRLQEENEKKEETIIELRMGEERRKVLERELNIREEEVTQLKKDRVLLEQKVQQLSEPVNCPNCDSVFSSLELEQRETSRLMKENKALVNGIFQLQTEVTSLQSQLKEQSDRCDSLSEQLSMTESHSEERAASINSLRQELDHLKLVKEEEEEQVRTCVHCSNAQEERRVALEALSEKSQQLQTLQRDRATLEEMLTQSWCQEKDKVIDKGLRQTETLRREVEHLQEELQRRDAEEKENRRVEIQRSTVRSTRGRRQQQEESQPVQNLQEDAKRLPVTPLTSSLPGKKNLPKKTGRKRKSCQLEELVFSESKKNQLRGNSNQGSPVAMGGGALQISEGTSPSVLGSRANNEMFPTATKAGRRRRKLYKTAASSPLLDSPLMSSAEAVEEKESDHFIIKRQLRSKTCRK